MEIYLLFLGSVLRLGGLVGTDFPLPVSVQTAPLKPNFQLPEVGSCNQTSGSWMLGIEVQLPEVGIRKLGLNFRELVVGHWTSRRQGLPSIVAPLSVDIRAFVSCSLPELQPFRPPGSSLGRMRCPSLVRLFHGCRSL